MGPATGLHNAVAARDEHEKHGHREGNDQPPVIDMEDQTGAGTTPVMRNMCTGQHAGQLLFSTARTYHSRSKRRRRSNKRRDISVASAVSSQNICRTGSDRTESCLSLLDGVPGNSQNAVTGQQSAGRSSRYPRATARSEDHVHPRTRLSEVRANLGKSSNKRVYTRAVLHRVCTRFRTPIAALILGLRRRLHPIPTGLPRCAGLSSGVTCSW